jgi:aminoglycoside phosphotransferase (APT) family kinase protein
VPPERLTLTHCRTGKFNTSYFVDGAAQPLVLRIAPRPDRAQVLFYEHGMMRQEPDLHALLRARTSVPVPAIVAHDFSGRAIDRDFLVMERMPGMPISRLGSRAPHACDDVLRKLGRSLRQVHGLTGDRYGYVGAHRPMEPQADWATAFATMWHLLLDDIERCGGYSAGEARRMRRLLDRSITVFDRPVPASMLHMDVWAENILADGRGRLTGLIDWDRALWGDPEIEFAVLDYCGISTPPFWEGYGVPRDTSPEAELRHVFYWLYELQKYIVIRRVRNHDPGRADAYRRESLQLVRALGEDGTASPT